MVDGRWCSYESSPRTIFLLYRYMYIYIHPESTSLRPIPIRMRIRSQSVAASSDAFALYGHAKGGLALKVKWWRLGCPTLTSRTRGVTLHEVDLNCSCTRQTRRAHSFETCGVSICYSRLVLAWLRCWPSAQHRCFRIAFVLSRSCCYGRSLWLLVGLISRDTEVAIAPEKLRVQLSSNDCFCRVNSNSSGERPVSQKQWVSPAAVFPRKKSLVDVEIRCQVWERRSPCRIIVSKVVWYRCVGRRHSRFNDADKAVLPTMGQLTTTLRQSLDALQRLIARCSDSKQSPELSFIPWITS